MTSERAIAELKKLKCLTNGIVGEALRMAIEALSKPIVDITQRELCEDISCTDCPFMKETCKLMDYVADAEAVQVWIPCSERLPKKGEVVLITNGKGNVRCGQYRSEHDVRGGTHYWWWKGKTVESVLAWMPLPKPHKGGDDK